MFLYIVLTPIYTTSGLLSTGNMRKYQQIDVYIYQCTNTRINKTSGDKHTLLCRRLGQLAMLPMPRHQSHRSTSHIEVDNVYHPPRGETLAHLVVL